MGIHFALTPNKQEDSSYTLVWVPQIVLKIIILNWRNFGCGMVPVSSMNISSNLSHFCFHGCWRVSVASVFFLGFWFVSGALFF